MMVDRCPAEDSFAVSPTVAFSLKPNRKCFNKKDYPDGQKKEITWHVNLTERHGVERYPLGTDAELTLICEARSEHAFVDKVGRVIRLPRAVPALAQKIELLREHVDAAEAPEKKGEKE